MKYLKTFAVFFSLVFLSGCWFIFVPVSPIVRAIQGPRCCIKDYKRIGDKIRAPNKKVAKITEIHGYSDSCKSPDYPILASIEYDEE